MTDKKLKCPLKQIKDTVKMCLSSEEKIDFDNYKTQEQNRQAIEGKLKPKSISDLSNEELVRYTINKINWLSDEDCTITQRQRDIALLQSAYWTRIDCIDFVIYAKGFIYNCIYNK
jgi:hypothetical protein